MKKLKLEKQETTYYAVLDVSKYDHLEVVEDIEGRITIAFNDKRWRTVEDTIKVLEEIIQILKTKPIKND